jgi:hypothetical protein
MAQGYYTLEEAAKVLGMSPEKLNKLAQDPRWLKDQKVNAFRDPKVVWRFRVQDVDALAGQAQSMGEAPAKGPSTPVGAGKRPEESSVFDFPMPEGGSGQVDIGGDILAPGPSSTPKASKSGPRRSDSDVHLILDEGSTFNPASDSGLRKEGSSSKSDVKLGVAPDSGPKPNTGSGPKSGPRKSPLPPGSRVDSGVRLVPLDSDEDLESIQHEPGRAPSDSSVRIDPASGPSGSKVKGTGHEYLPTEEVDLDAELRKAEEAARGHKPRTKVKPRSGVGGVPAGGIPESTEELSLPEDELHLEQGEDVTLGELAPKDVLKGSSGASGIGMHSPADSGVDLEKAGQAPDESEFELSLEPPSSKVKGPRTPSAAAPEGSSEFELTLDEGGGLAPLEEGDSGEKDIFETDFDMPALEDESGSEAVPLDEPDTNLESSDFDLAVEGGKGEGESGSQVVALDDEEADEGAATVAKRRAEVAEEEEAGEIDELIGEEEAAPEEELEPAMVAAPAEWGTFWSLLMIPCFLAMFLLTLMSFELLHTMWGYNQAYKPTGTILKAITPSDMLPDDAKK